MARFNTLSASERHNNTFTLYDEANGRTIHAVYEPYRSAYECIIEEVDENGTEGYAAIMGEGDLANCEIKAVNDYERIQPFVDGEPQDAIPEITTAENWAQCLVNELCATGGEWFADGETHTVTIMGFLYGLEVEISKAEVTRCGNEYEITEF